MSAGLISERRFPHGRGVALFGSNDIPALVNALGGDSAVLAIYDARYGTTVSSGAVSRWDDARGASGFGPALLSVSGNPSVGTGGGHSIEFDGTTSAGMQSALLSSLSLEGARSLVYVGTTPLRVTGATKYAAYVFSAATAGIALRCPDTATVFGLVNALNLNTAVAADGTRRLMVVSKDASTAGAAQVANHAAATGAATALAAADSRIGIGVPSTGLSVLSVNAMLLLARQATAGDVATLAAWAVKYHGAVLAT